MPLMSEKISKLDVEWQCLNRGRHTPTREWTLNKHTLQGGCCCWALISSQLVVWSSSASLCCMCMFDRGSKGHSSSWPHRLPAVPETLAASSYRDWRGRDYDPSLWPMVGGAWTLLTNYMIEKSQLRGHSRIQCSHQFLFLFQCIALLLLAKIDKLDAFQHSLCQKLSMSLRWSIPIWGWARFND